MAIPDYQSLMLPLLNLVGDGNEHSFREVIEALAKEFKLSEEECKVMLPSGTARLFDNRVGWNNTYLKKAGLIESKRRGYLNITPTGKAVLAQNPEIINDKFLQQFPSFQEFMRASKPKGGIRGRP